MKTRYKHYLILGILFLYFIPNSFSQSDATGWVSVGVSYGGLVGEGLAGNNFDPSVGFKLDWGYRVENGFGLIVYSFGYYKTKNHVNESTAEVTFNHHLWELRYFFLKGRRVQPYIALGIGLGSMKFEGMKGRSRFGMIPYGAGVQFKAADHVMIEGYFKPYSATKNQLEHNFGYETGISVGYLFKY